MNDEPRLTQSPSDKPAEPVAPPPRRSHGVRWAVILLALAAIAGLLYYNYRFAGQETANAVPAGAPKPPPVTVSHPLVKTITEWDEYTGQFQAVDSVAVRARVSGYLTEIHFTDGQWVKKGDLLFVIDPRPFQIDLDSARAQLSQAQARVQWANAELARTGALRKGDYATASDYDTKLNEARAAATSVETAKAAIAAAQLNLDFTHITAPLDGRMGTHLVSIGNLVMGNTTGSSDVLATIVSLKPIRFIFDMSENEYLAYQRAVAEKRLKVNLTGAIPAYVKLADETSWAHADYLDFVDNQIDPGSGTIRIRAQFPNADLFIAPGTFGRLRLPASDPYPAILIPDAAIVSDQSRKLVMTVKPDGSVVPKVIRPGPSYGNLRIVRNGITADDVIIIDGLLRVRPGGKVTPEPGKIELDESGS
ncbi:MAG TPA: efflux RND transporter periplasmic adaptor subunit [Dongiaceae bacterium]|nr:efflux RND transporter periplasmic adaptor subunit [Dongiaceae bacterium]